MNTRRHNPLVRAIALAVLVFLCAQTAFAHPQKGEAVGFLTGFRHPISGLDHVLAMVAVGLWGAQLGAPAIWLLPVTFPLVMVEPMGAMPTGSWMGHWEAGDSLLLAFCIRDSPLPSSVLTTATQTTTDGA